MTVSWGFLSYFQKMHKFSYPYTPTLSTSPTATYIQQLSRCKTFWIMWSVTTSSIYPPLLLPIYLYIYPNYKSSSFHQLLSVSAAHRSPRPIQFLLDKLMNWFFSLCQYPTPFIFLGRSSRYLQCGIFAIIPIFLIKLSSSTRILKHKYNYIIHLKTSMWRILPRFMRSFTSYSTPDIFN